MNQTRATAMKLTIVISALLPTIASAYSPCERAIARRDAAFAEISAAIRRCDNRTPGDGCPVSSPHYAEVARATRIWEALVEEARRECR